MSVSVVRWTHPALGVITEALCPEHCAIVVNALNLVALVYGYADTGDADDEEAPECVRCLWDAPYGPDGLPPVHVRLRLEAMVFAEISRALGGGWEPGRRTA